MAVEQICNHKAFWGGGLRWERSIELQNTGGGGEARLAPQRKLRPKCPQEGKPRRNKPIHAEISGSPAIGNTRCPGNSEWRGAPWNKCWKYNEQLDYRSQLPAYGARQLPLPVQLKTGLFSKVDAEAMRTQTTGHSSGGDGSPDSSNIPIFSCAPYRVHWSMTQ